MYKNVAFNLLLSFKKSSISWRPFLRPSFSSVNALISESSWIFFSVSVFVVFLKLIYYKVSTIYVIRLTKIFSLIRHNNRYLGEPFFFVSCFSAPSLSLSCKISSILLSLYPKDLRTFVNFSTFSLILRFKISEFTSLSSNFLISLHIIELVFSRSLYFFTTPSVTIVSWDGILYVCLL